ncbi:PilZ domain-containing protein [Sphingosinicella sp. CPCC 101087]|uniref:PilZ domain-containing protein n=1 Tax=Sphingosinicella sp. CPCC 101087 TaxID=2497754 RepID=UPI00101C99BA|nr:PilZ domain-containing protein [Sphingosinicella sp. CPCC 101087]
MTAFSGHWSPSFSAPLTLSGEISTHVEFDAPTRKSRRSERVPVALGAGLRQRGASGVSVQITDLSTDGFRVATHLELQVGTDVWLRLPGLEASHARVVWAEGQSIGCAFIRPLHPAVLEMIVAKSQRR